MGIVGALISIALLWWTLHDVSLNEVWQHLGRVRPLPLLGTIVLATASFPLRTVRWRYLLRYEGSSLAFTPLWHATAIGFMANNILPARAGELARAYTARRLTPVRFSTAFASIAVERVMDGIILVALLAIAIWAGGFAPGTAVGGFTLGGIAQSGAVLFAGLLVVALVLVHWPGPALRVADWIARRVFSDRWAAWLMETLRGMLAGLDALRSAGRFAAITLWSLVVWLVTATSFWLGFVAFGIEVPWSAALLLLGLIAFGVAIPAAPGFFGPFEAFSRLALALYGVAPDHAVSYAIGYHISTFFPITLLGIWSLSRAHLHLRDLQEQRESDITA